MKRIWAILLSFMLAFSAAFVLLDMRDDAEGKMTSTNVNVNSVFNINTGEYFTEIQTAIDDSDTQDGHTIEVYAGTYLENVVVNKSINLIGESNISTIINGNETGDVIIVFADNVTISGFNITYSGSKPDDAGIELRGVQNCSVEDNVLMNNEIGIYVSSYYDDNSIIQVTDNDIYDTYPVLNNNGEVVWRGLANVEYEIFLWDGSVISQLTNNTFYDWAYQINDNGRIVWSGGWPQTPNGNEIYTWIGGITHQVTNDLYNDLWPQINNHNQIAWYGYDGNDMEIFFWDSGPPIIQITDNVYDDTRPMINQDGHIVWEGDIGSDTEILYWDGSQTSIITNNVNSDYNPQINNLGQVTWWTYYGSGDCEIFFWDGVNTTQVTNDDYWHSDVRINNHGQLIWRRVIEDIINGTENHTLQFWDGNTVTQISTDDWDTINPRINDEGQVFWIAFDEWEATIPHLEGEIFYWNGLKEIQLTNRTQSEYNPEINDRGQIAWSGMFYNTSEPYNGSLSEEIYFWNPTLSQNNMIQDNYISNNFLGIFIDNSKNNKISHNSLVNNSIQAHDDGNNTWDNGYPSGGNYWSDYNGIDVFNGTGQNITGSDGIGDTPYVIPQGVSSVKDNYPLMEPCLMLPSVWVSSPDGGESLMGNGTWEITWDVKIGHFPLISNPISIEYSINGPTGPWMTIAENESNDGLLTWNPVPVINEIDCAIKISAEDTQGFVGSDISNASFNIDSTSPSPVTNTYAEITGPNDITIHWNASPSLDISHYEIYYSMNNWDSSGDSYQLLGITNGTSYLHQNAGKINPNAYFWQVRAVDFAGHVTKPLKQGGKESNTLSILVNPSGWFLQGHYLNLTNPSVEYVLQSLGVNVDHVQLYRNSQWLHWASYWPSSLNTLTDIYQGEGFWVHITANSRLCVAGQVSDVAIPMKAGWNLVAYPSPVQDTVANALWGTGADSVMVCDTSEPYHIKEVGPTFLMKPGEGYWVHVPADTVWVVDW